MLSKRQFTKKFLNYLGKHSIHLETFEVLRPNVVASGGENFKSLNGYSLVRNAICQSATLGNAKNATVQLLIW
jgi:hypothetical protein